MENWTVTEVDLQLREELKSFVPDRIFDAHSHWYAQRHLHESKSTIFTEGPAECGAAVWKRWIGETTGVSPVGGLAFPTPTPNADLAASNDFLIRELVANPGSRGLLLVSANTNPASLPSHRQILGLKPYHVYATKKPTFQAPIPTFVPPKLWAYADEHRSILMLHVVRTDAISDERNLADLTELCTAYPGAKVVLAHAGRSFHAHHVGRALERLSSLDNIWFDSSGICEPEPLAAILRAFGPKRLMWGSDFPVCAIRGRAVTVGDGFAWIDPASYRFEDQPVGCRPTLVGIESVRALRSACESLGFSDGEVAEIFYGTAARLLSLESTGEESVQDRYQKARAIIPGGTGLLSKRPERFLPKRWPAYFSEARGCETWDTDGRRYLDFSMMGIGACILGFGDPDVSAAVTRRVTLGSMCTLNPPEEVALAERLLDLHRWADNARFARTGGEACAMAVRIARATTGRSRVAICGYHGWHDWYLAANLADSAALDGHLLPGLSPSGVPRELLGTAATFRSDSIEEFDAVVDDADAAPLAAVVMEPCRYHDPAPGFLEHVRRRCREIGAMLIFDEITIGFRLTHGGAHLRFSVDPDIAVFAKALGNGHPIAAVVGSSGAMEGARESFISSTYWTEAVGPVAALATLEKLERVGAQARIAMIGSSLQTALRDAAKAAGLSLTVSESYPCLVKFAFGGSNPLVMEALFVDRMLERGFLASTAIYPSVAHTDSKIRRYEAAVREVFTELAEIERRGAAREAYPGELPEKDFARLL